MGASLRARWHRRIPGCHTTSETGQGCPSRSPSSPLPSSGGTSVAILFSSPSDVLLATHLLRCFGLLPFLISFYFNHAAVIHRHLLSLFIFLSVQGKKYLSRLQKVMTPSHQGFILLWARSFWQTNFILDAGGSTCLTKLNADLPKSLLKSKEKRHGRADVDQHTPEAQKKPTTAL